VAALDSGRTARRFGIAADSMKKHDIHIFTFPEGATPKDGPSAGVGIVTPWCPIDPYFRCVADVAMDWRDHFAGSGFAELAASRKKLLAAHVAG